MCAHTGGARRGTTRRWYVRWNSWPTSKSVRRTEAQRTRSLRSERRDRFRLVRSLVLPSHRTSRAMDTSTRAVETDVRRRDRRWRALCLPPHLPPLTRWTSDRDRCGQGVSRDGARSRTERRGKAQGLVVTRDGYGVPPAHRDRRGRTSRPRCRRHRAGATNPAKGVGFDSYDLGLCLISGGGSSLLAAPAPGLTLVDKQAVNRALLKSGSEHLETVSVRRHLSALKGAAALQLRAIRQRSSRCSCPTYRRATNPIDIASVPRGYRHHDGDLRARDQRDAIQVPANVRRLLESVKAYAG